VVTVVKAAKFMDRDGLAGRFRARSFLPQYLIKAIFGFATAVALPIAPPRATAA
jgi:hypothetical protein